jgi:MFS family permease
MESWKLTLFLVRLFFHRSCHQSNLTVLALTSPSWGLFARSAVDVVRVDLQRHVSGFRDCVTLWGSLADRKGRKLMLLRASLGMAIAILLQAFATNVWQLLILRGVMGLTSGYIPNAMALVASQAPRERSGWALSTLSTAQISGVIGGPLMGGFLADHLVYERFFNHRDAADRQFSGHAVSD